MPQPSLTLARLRLRWHRRAVATWAAVVACAATAGFLVGSAGGTTATRQPLPPTRRVVVVSHGTPAGHDLDGRLAYRRLPVPAVPEQAVTTMPKGRAARIDLHRGEVLTADRISGAAGHGPAALLEPGYRGVTIPLPDTAPTLRVGDRIDVVHAPTADTASVEAAGVTVIDARPDAVTVAVPARQVPAVAAALGDGSVTVVFAAPGS